MSSANNYWSKNPIVNNSNRETEKKKRMEMKKKSEREREKIVKSERKNLFF